jgi:hypothetical protein
MTEHTCPGYLTDPPEIQQAIDDGGYWLACEWPERRVDSKMITIAGCPACMIAEVAANRLGMTAGSASTVEDVIERLAEGAPPW